MRHGEIGTDGLSALVNRVRSAAPMAVLVVLLFASVANADAPVGSLFFPLTPGSTWKYQVTAKTGDKADRPYVQTLTVGAVVAFNGQQLLPLDNLAYLNKPDGVYVAAGGLAGKLVALEPPQKLVPAHPHTSESWNFSAGSESTNSTCLGSQKIKTEAGEFETQCIFSTTTGGPEGQNHRQTYRYFASGVGLVRETVSEKSTTANGVVNTREVTRDLLAYVSVGGDNAAGAVDAGRGGAADAFATGKKLANSGDHNGAVAAYDAALKLDPDNATIRAYKAASLLAMGQATAAQVEIDDALRRNEKSAIAWEVAGQIRIARNEITPGRNLFEKAARLSPAEAGSIYTDLAAALANRHEDQLNTAIEQALQQACDANPPSAEALFQLGQSYASAGRPQSQSYLQRYIDIETKLPVEQRDTRKLQLARQLVRAMKMLNQ